jgi:hypothetical protein
MFDSGPFTAEAAWRVGIGREHHARGFGAEDGEPRPRVGEEEALLGSEAVDRRARLAPQRALHRLVGDRHADDVGDVLAQRQRPFRRSVSITT